MESGSLWHHGEAILETQAFLAEHRPCYLSPLRCFSLGPSQGWLLATTVTCEFT